MAGKHPLLFLLGWILLVKGTVNHLHNNSITLQIGDRKCVCDCNAASAFQSRRTSRFIEPPSKHLNIVFKQLVPWVYFDNRDRPIGILFELWLINLSLHVSLQTMHQISYILEICRKMVAEFHGWNYTYQIMKKTSNELIEDFTKDPEIDVLLGDFTMTWKRINRFNVQLTTPFASKGLLLMRKIPPSSQDGWWILKSFTEWCWATFFLFVFISAFVIWLCEHWENLSFYYVYQYFCCCKSPNEIMHELDINTSKSDEHDISSNTHNEGLQASLTLKRGKSSKSLDDIEMSTIHEETSNPISTKTKIYHRKSVPDTLDGNATIYKSLETNHEFQDVPLDDIDENKHDPDQNGNVIIIKKEEEKKPIRKKPKFMPTVGNTLALFWFGGMFPHVKTAPAKFLIAFLKLWVLVMSSFYMANLTALRTAEIAHPSEVQSTEDMWHARICAKANSFIEEFLYEELALPNVVTCDQQPDCIEMLLNDDCDGFVGGSHWVQYMSKLHCELEVIGDLMRPEFASWILKKDTVYQDLINNALTKFRSEGVVDKLLKKYIDIPKRCDKRDEGGKFSGNENQVDVVELDIMWFGIGCAWIFSLGLQWYRTRKV